MIAGLARYLPHVTFNVPQGGYYLWVRLPEGADADRLWPIACRRGVRFLAGSQFYATRGPGNYLRLAYSYASPSEITEGVRRLGEAVKEMR